MGALQQGTQASPLFEGSPGVFYGTIPTRGAFGYGSIFRVTAAGSFALEYNFGGAGNVGNGTNPQDIMLGPDGNLYGITSSGGNLTLSCGTVFGFDGTTLSTLHQFGSGEGCHPSGGLYYGFGQGGLRTLYGTTGLIGGSQTIYSLDFFGTLTTLHTFGSSGDGSHPNSPLVVIDPTSGTLIGTTQSGGGFGYGTLYELQFHQGSQPTESVVYNFSGSSMLANQSPVGWLAPANDVVYGNVSGLGGYQDGNLFAFQYSNLFTALLIFAPPPHQSGACSGPMFGNDGYVYGATCFGGTFGLGYVYKYNPSTQIATTIHSFSSSEGYTVLAPLTLGSDGNLYGTTFTGGQFGYGTIFKLTENGALTVLHSFSKAD